MPNHDHVKRWHGVLTQSWLIIVPIARRPSIKAVNSTIDEDHPSKVFIGGRNAVLLCLDDAFELVYGTKETQVTLELRYIDKRADLAGPNGETLWKLGRILVISGWRLLSFLLHDQRCRK